MKRLQYLLAALLVLALTSCGGGSPVTQIDVTMIDFQFTPNQFTIPAGQEITLHVKNTGAVVHNFVIMKLGTSAGDAFDEEDEANIYWQERDIPSGGDFSATFTAPTEPGEYQLVCKTEGHIASGMIGKLIVVAGQ